MRLISFPVVAAITLLLVWAPSPHPPAWQQEPTPLPTLPYPAGTPGVFGTPIPYPPLLTEKAVILNPLEADVTLSGFPSAAVLGDSTLMMKSDQREATAAVTLRITVARDGYYDLFTFIPPVADRTQNARYIITDGVGRTRARLIDQQAVTGWVHLGSYYMATPGQQRVFISNQTGEERAAARVLLGEVAYQAK